MVCDQEPERHSPADGVVRNLPGAQTGIDVIVQVEPGFLHQPEDDRRRQDLRYDAAWKSVWSVTILPAAESMTPYPFTHATR